MTIHSLSGFISLQLDLIDDKSRPDGADGYRLTFLKELVQGGSAPDATEWKVSAVYHEIVMVTAVAAIASLGDSTGPFANFGGVNTPSVDPEGMYLKLIALANRSDPTDGSGGAIAFRAGANAWNVVYSWAALPTLTGVADGARIINPGEIALNAAPAVGAGGTGTVNDGVDDELEFKSLAGAVPMEVLLVWG